MYTDRFIYISEIILASIQRQKRRYQMLRLIVMASSIDKHNMWILYNHCLLSRVKGSTTCFGPNFNKPKTVTNSLTWTKCLLHRHSLNWTKCSHWRISSISSFQCDGTDMKFKQRACQIMKSGFFVLKKFRKANFVLS